MSKIKILDLEKPLECKNYLRYVIIACVFVGMNVFTIRAMSEVTNRMVDIVNTVHSKPSLKELSELELANSENEK